MPHVRKSRFVVEMAGHKKPQPAITIYFLLDAQIIPKKQTLAVTAHTLLEAVRYWLMRCNTELAGGW